MNLCLKAQNGEEPFNSEYKFDRIIGNMVLMLTEDPEKMLKNLYDHADEGCLLGISVWGDPSLNEIQSILNDLFKSTGETVPKNRPNAHLWNKVSSLA